MQSSCWKTWNKSHQKVIFFALWAENVTKYFILRKTIGVIFLYHHLDIHVKNINILLIFSVQFSSVTQSCLTFATPWIAARQASLPITNCPLLISISKLISKLISMESVMPSSHLILCRPLLLLPQSLPASGSFPRSQLFA